MISMLFFFVRSELESTLVEDDDDSLIIGDLKRNMLAKLDKRFPVTDLNVTAALLDPRCNNLAVVNRYIEEKGCSKEQFLARQVRAHIKECHLPGYARIDPAQSEQSASAPAAASSSAKKKTTAEELMELAKKHSDSRETSRTAVVEKEVKSFFSTSSADDVKDNDILRFWRERRHQFPWLSTAVRKSRGT